MIHNTRPVGFNRCIRDAMELKNLDLEGLSSLLGIDADKCQRALGQEMIKIKKMSWLSKIFDRHFDTPGQWEVYIEKMIAERGPEWLEEPPLIEGSSRYYHQLYKQFRPDRKREAADE